MNCIFFEFGLSLVRIEAIERVATEIRLLQANECFMIVCSCNSSVMIGEYTNMGAASCGVSESEVRVWIHCCLVDLSSVFLKA